MYSLTIKDLATGTVVAELTGVTSHSFDGDILTVMTVHPNDMTIKLAPGWMVLHP